MVMNSFGKRNFLQLMGRLKHPINVLCFFSLLNLLGRGWGKEG
jgi:hypothetical protein